MIQHDFAIDVVQYVLRTGKYENIQNKQFHNEIFVYLYNFGVCFTNVLRKKIADG